jgi:hypothetical protein
MKYETPQLTTLMPAIDAIQSVKLTLPAVDGHFEDIAAYQDWED